LEIIWLKKQNGVNDTEMDAYLWSGVIVKILSDHKLVDPAKQARRDLKRVLFDEVKFKLDKRVDQGRENDSINQKDQNTGGKDVTRIYVMREKAWLVIKNRDDQIGGSAWDH
jgi:hypothetical protein